MIRLMALVLCFAYLSETSVLAQDQKKVDSLHRLLEHRVGFCEQFEALYELCFEYLKKDNVKALNYIEQAEAAAMSSGDSLWIVKSMRMKGILLYYLERNTEALEIFQVAVRMAERNGYKKERIYIHQFVGRIYLYEGQYDKALSIFLDGLHLAVTLNDHNEIATSWHDVGICYYKLSDYHQALQYFSKALDSYKSFSLPQGVVVTNMALCYANLGQLEKAKEVNGIAASMSEVECPNGCQLNLKYSMGLVAMLEQNYSQAEAYLSESYVMAQRLPDTRFQLDNIYLLTEIFVKQKKFTKVKEYLDIGEELMQRNPSYNLEMIKIYSRFAEVYTELRDFRMASIYQSKYIALRDSIYREELTNSLMKVQSEYLERENQAKIEAQREIILLNREILDGQRKLSTTTGVIAGLAALILVFVVREYRRNKKLSKLLGQKVQERTNALELGRSELLSIIREQNSILRYLSRGTSQRMKTIRGLCYAACKDVTDPRVYSCLERIESTSNEVEHFVSTAHNRIVAQDGL